MFRPLRSAISVVLLGLGLWAAFAVELGDKTFAEHVDTISETPAAQELIDDTRSTINPALVEVRDRVLGEYVEAPTWIPEEDPTLAAGRELEGSKREGRAERERAAEDPAVGTGEPPLPGRRPSGKPRAALEPGSTGAASEPEVAAGHESPAGFEPALPGRR